MVKMLKDVSVFDLLPNNAQGDKNIRSAAMALDGDLAALYGRISSISYYRRIMQGDLTDAEADELAWQFNLPYYDPTLPLTQKIQLLQAATETNRSKGTPAAIERLISILFGDGEVQEWNQYGGEPGYYRVVTSNEDVTAERAEEFARAIKSVTRLSAWLESVTLIKQEEQVLYYGAATQRGRKAKMRG
ncbi:phage tail protein I [Paenibacillus hubeiensis]|uniref:phage tail protein I n=1 Tax=Paenibacillus hubeiensis TaxID=3077330 RepID=UPI0031BB5D2D